MEEPDPSMSVVRRASSSATPPAADEPLNTEPAFAFPILLCGFEEEALLGLSVLLSCCNILPSLSTPDAMEDGGEGSARLV